MFWLGGGGMSFYEKGKGFIYVQINLFGTNSKEYL